MSLFGGIYVGASGLQTSQNALNTTTHNLVNVDTLGYSRQQYLFGDKFYNTVGQAGVSKMQVGLGVDYAKVRQVRDQFLDASFRKESGRSAFYTVCEETTSEMETLLGEFEGAAFEESLSDLWTSIEELNKDPSSAVTQGVFISECNQFLERAQAVYTGLCEYQDNLNGRISDQVKRVNEIAHEIHALNVKIQHAESGVEEANDLRDTRNYLLDELSSLVKITTGENAYGGTEIYVEDVPLLIGDYVNEMDLVRDESTGFYNVTWGKDYENMAVFRFDIEISSDKESDMGQLKATLLARGDHRANYTDMINDAGELDKDKYNDSVLLAGKEYLDSDGKVVKVDTYSIPASLSIVMNIESELDRLVHTLVKNINNILTGGEVSEKDASGIEVFVRLGTERYDAAGNYVKDDDISGSPNDISKLYCLNNLKINPDLIKQPTLNSFILDDKSVDHAKAQALTDAFSAAKIELNPNTSTKLNFTDFYAGLCGQVANSGSVYKSFVAAQEATVSQIENARQEVVGVSSDEELQNMIKFQNAYNASSRYINVLNEMLDTILQI